MSKQKHSHAYHRYFENYAEKEILLPGGGRTIHRVYVGKYYRVDLSDEQLLRQRILIGFLFVCALVGYLAGALLAKVSAVSLVALATMPPLVALIFLGIAVFYRLTVPREMEIRAFRDSSINLQRSSMAAFLCTAICFCATLAGCLLIPLFSLGQTLPALICYAGSVGASLKLYLTEKSTGYQSLDPRQERPEKSSPIRYEMPD